MEPQIITITAIEPLTHDVLRIIAEKPETLAYKPGQAADISVNKTGWEQEFRAFTFTSLPEEDKVEFTIKTYPSHKGVTNQLLLLVPGDELIIHDVFGTIDYKGEGIFIAGGAGVTPFIAILKWLEAKKKIGNSKLLFANKTRADIIHEDLFRELLGSRFINILSDEKCQGYEQGFISEALIRKHSSEQRPYYYLCGPDPMMQAVGSHLSAMGVESEFIVQEAF